MPNHIHLILYFKDQNYLSSLMRDFKKFTGGEIRRKLEKDGHSRLVESLRFERSQQKFKVWMDRFDDVYLESKHVLETKLDYIHDNPVKKNLCEYPEDYRYSSAAFYEKGLETPLKVTHYMAYF